MSMSAIHDNALYDIKELRARCFVCMVFEAYTPLFVRGTKRDRRDRSYFPPISAPERLVQQAFATLVDGIELGGELAYQCALESLASGDEDQTLGAAYALASINDKGQALTTIVNTFAQASDSEYYMSISCLHILPYIPYPASPQKAVKRTSLPTVTASNSAVNSPTSVPWNFLQAATRIKS